MAAATDTEANADVVRAARRPHYGALVAVGLCSAVLAGCGSSGPSQGAGSSPIRAPLARYLAQIEPTIPALRSLHAEYAQTYVLEDAYLSALASGLAHHELGNLPDTQSAQRAAIIGWRTGLTVLARQARFGLPPDLQQAGRGEIAPSPQAS